MISGMKLDCGSEGEVKVDVAECVMKMIEEFECDFGDFEPTTPAADHSFEVHDDTPELDNNEKANVSHCDSKRIVFV